MTDKRIYLDYSATTPVRPEVRAAMAPFFETEFGNPSSMHSYGRAAKVAIENSRRQLRQSLGATSGDGLVFTGSGSEADNLAVLGFARRHRSGCVVRSSIEHKAVTASARALQREAYDVRVAPVDGRGVIDIDALRATVPSDGRPTLLSVMWANNETGVVQPIADIAELCAERGAVLFSDAVQALGKIPLALEKLSLGLFAFSAHKIGGPKGVGGLLIRGGVELDPIVLGGGQESGLRSGTENVAGIVGFAQAAALSVGELDQEAARLCDLRDRLQSGLQVALPEIVVNGADAPRLPNVLNLSVPDLDLEGALTALDLEGICVSSGSACTTGSVAASHVLAAMGRGGDLARNTIRLSLGWGTQAEDIEYVVNTLPKVVARVRRFAAGT
ncbi:MAG: cysteine desulfurase family protein [Gemmatimonadales bacterium]|jgi:cysteine desulfurase